VRTNTGETNYLQLRTDSACWILVNKKYPNVHTCFIWLAQYV